MRRDLVITALLFVVIGFAGGILYSRYTHNSPLRPTAPPSVAAESQQDLPEGHPPLDVSQRWNTLRQQAEANPRDVQAALELANFLYDIERWQDAIFWYRRALELEPKNTDARTDLATSYHNLGRYDEAIAEYNRSLEFEPNKPQALFGLGMARLRGKQDAAGARRLLEQLRRTHPDFPGIEILAKELGEGRPRS